MTRFTRSIILCAFLGLSTTAFSQDIDILAGLGLGFNSEASAIGIQFKGDVDITEQWGGSLNFTPYFSSDFNYWELNFDGHYFFPINDEFKAYALAGLNISHVGLDIPGFGGFGFTGAGGTKVGLNLGGGARYAVAENISLYAEIKYIISNLDAFVISAGGLYHF